VCLAQFVAARLIVAALVPGCAHVLGVLASSRGRKRRDWRWGTKRQSWRRAEPIIIEFGSSPARWHAFDDSWRREGRAFS
jgi:hypothetical protein